MAYNFTPAAPDESIVYGACRPRHGYSPTNSTVEDWIEFMQRDGIQRVCCLLDEKLSQYDGLLDTYEANFGTENVCHAPVADYSTIEAEPFYGKVLPFLRQAVAQNEPVVVHCSAGMGRTGHVLVGWLVVERDYSLNEGIDTVASMGRSPLEAQTSTRRSLQTLFCETTSPRAAIDVPPSFSGIGASPAIASGPIQHIDSISEMGSEARADALATVTEGDILVTPEFEVPLLPTIDRIAAVITYKRLSLTSKGAVVSRDEEIPAVVSCDRTIASVDDGTRVTVDGRYGYVYDE